MTPPKPRLPEPGDVVELTVGEVANGGWCVARTDAGPVVFVRHALPGERVRAVITQTTSRFARADAAQILDASADRVPPPCPYARPGGCGGCDWQHAALPAQRALKAAVIGQQLRRIAGIDRDVTVEPMPGDETGLGWRTRVKFAVTRGGAAGLRRHRSHEVMEIGDGLIAHPLVETAAVTGRRWPGAASVEVAVAPGSGERALVVSGRKAAGHDPAHLRQRAAGRDWRVSATGFWQVHPAAADTLAAAVLDALRPRPGDVALDVYCGAGLFAGVLADAVGPSGTVIGIEADAAAVPDARHNLRGTPWARVYRGDAAALLERSAREGATLAVVDPPRTGLDRKVVDLLSGPGQLRRIAYVSCDPATLARDIGVFGASGWELEALRAFDAFPMTHHVECLATLTRDW